MKNEKHSNKEIFRPVVNSLGYLVIFFLLRVTNYFEVG